MADYVQRPHEAYGYSWLQWQMPHRFNGQPMLLSQSYPGSPEYQARAMETLERFGSRVRGADIRLQDLDWAMIVEIVLARLLDPLAARVPPPRPRRTPLRADIDFSKHRIVRAPPTLSEARAYMAETTGIEVLRTTSSPSVHGSWIVFSRKRACVLAAGPRSSTSRSSTACIVASQWQRPGPPRLREGPHSGTGTWTSATPATTGLGTSTSPSPVCGSSSRSTTRSWISCASSSTSRPLSWTARGCLSFFGAPKAWCGEDFSLPRCSSSQSSAVSMARRLLHMATVQASRALEQRLVDRYRVHDPRRGVGVEIDYMERGQRGGATRPPGSGPTTATGLPQGTPMLLVLRALLPPLLPPRFPRQPSQVGASRGTSRLARHVRMRPSRGRSGRGSDLGGVRTWDAPAVLDDVRDPQRAQREGGRKGGRTRARCARPAPRPVLHLP